MNIIYILAPLALMLGLIGIVAFLWAVNKGQFDDMDTPAKRMLIDDKPVVKDEH